MKSSITLMIGILFAVAPSAYAGEVAFWYEDSNLRKAGGYPDDFQYMFENPDSWAELRSKLSVYCIRGNTLKNVVKDLGEEWVREHFCGVLKREKLPVAIDNPTSLPSIRLLQDGGVVVSHIALQSVLSKFEKYKLTSDERNAEITRRIDQAVRRLVELRQQFPDSKIGIIDALPAKGLPYAWPYAELKKKSTAAGAALQFVHVDAPYSKIEQVIKWKNVEQIKKTISDDLDLEFGVIVTDNEGGMRSNRSFHDQVMLMAEKYPRAAFPDYFIMMSWYDHPKYAVKNEGPEGEYTMARTSLAFINAVVAPKRRSQEQIFKNRDQNRDDVITLEEYIGNPKERNVPALTKRFKKIDSNGDGELTLDELKKATQ